MKSMLSLSHVDESYQTLPPLNSSKVILWLNQNLICLLVFITTDQQNPMILRPYCTHSMVRFFGQKLNLCNCKIIKTKIFNFLKLIKHKTLFKKLVNYRNLSIWSFFFPYFSFYKQLVHIPCRPKDNMIQWRPMDMRMKKKT